jgi:hypothetical protein
MELATQSPLITPKRYAVARYDSDRRVIVAQRSGSGVQLTDVSVDGGTSYVIEPPVPTRAEMDGIVADYLATAERIGRCPMTPGGWWLE